MIVATGATPCLPDIPGINRPNVFTAIDVLLGNVAIGDSIFIAGGGSVGVETAAFLSLQLKAITIANILSEFAPEEDRPHP